MAGPLTTKSPLFSMFLSAANASAGAARGILMAQAKRRQEAAVRQGTKQAIGIWASALTGAPPQRRPKRRS